MSAQTVSSIRPGIIKKHRGGPAAAGKLGQRNAHRERLSDERPQDVARTVGHVSPAQPVADKAFVEPAREVVFQTVTPIVIGSHLGNALMSDEAERELRRRRAEASRLAEEQEIERRARKLGFSPAYGVCP